MSQSQRGVFFVWPPCVPGCNLKPDSMHWFCTPTQSLTPPMGAPCITGNPTRNLRYNNRSWCPLSYKPCVHRKIESSLIATGVVPGYKWPRWLRFKLSKCLTCPKSSFNNLSNFMLYKLPWLSLGWRRNCQCFVFMDSPWSEYRSSLAGVVVEVLGIRTLHLAKLQCGLRCMVFMPGSGQSWNERATATRSSVH